MRASVSRGGIVALAGLACGFACEGTAPAPTDAGPLDAGPAMAIVDYAADSLYGAPWPDERLRGSDGRVSVASLPNTRGVEIVATLTRLLEGAEGFGRTSAVYFPLSAPIDEGSLPTLPSASVRDDASVFLVDVDPESPQRGERMPVTVRFQGDAGPFGAPNLLSLLPVQGRPLGAGRLYAAVLTTRVRDTRGASLEIAPATATLLTGGEPQGLGSAATTAHAVALETVRTLVPEAEIAATAVFRTWDPVRELSEARESLRELSAPIPGSFEAHEIFEDYCVFRGLVEMPDFQGGEPPYATEGGAWVRGEDGELVRQRSAEAAVWVTVPRRAMRPEGFPTAVFIRTGGGGDRPLVDRGPRPSQEAPPAQAGLGPARDFARAGWVGVSVDGPLGGLRNPEGWDEQFAIFNINNPPALRDSVRQSALELAHFVDGLEELTLDASSCPGLSTPDEAGIITLDTTELTLMGHSMGATIAPLAVAIEPRFRALVLSGAGASWIANVMYKLSPIGVRPAAEALLQYTARGRSLVEEDPALSLLQWVGEPADPQVYAEQVIPDASSGAARHVLMFQGILDTYIPPPVANPLTLTLGIDLGGEPLDETLSDTYEPIQGLLPLSGRGHVTLPATGNVAASGSTGVLVQHLEDDILDGHEIVFQSEAARRQIECFLGTLAEGTPTVVAPDATSCPP